MKYIDTSSGYVLENYDDIVEINDEDLNNFHFKRKHLALIKGLVFKAGADEDMPKKYKAEMSKLVLADTDLNVLSFFMNNEMYKTIDLTGIIRASEIDPMYNLVSKNKPNDLRSKKGNILTNLFTKGENIECCILFVNYETRERIFEHIIFDNNQHDKFFIDYSNRGFFPALILKREEIEKTYDKFNKIENKEIKLDFVEDVFVNARCVYGKELTEEEIKIITDPIYNLEKGWKDYKKDCLKDKELIKELEEEGRTIEEFFEESKESTVISFMTHLKRRNVNYETDILPYKTLDLITFARNDEEKLKKIFSLASETNEIYSSLISNNDLENEIRMKL